MDTGISGNNVEVETAGTKGTCQVRCQKNPQCKGFMYRNAKYYVADDRKKCFLKKVSIDSKNIRPGENEIAGPKACSEGKNYILKYFFKDEIFKFKLD